MLRSTSYPLPIPSPPIPPSPVCYWCRLLCPGQGELLSHSRQWLGSAWNSGCGGAIPPPYLPPLSIPCQPMSRHREVEHLPPPALSRAKFRPQQTPAGGGQELPLTPGQCRLRQQGQEEWKGWEGKGMCL